jgi:hypothetical protein
MNATTLPPSSLLVVLTVLLTGCDIADTQKWHRFTVRGYVQNQVCWLVEEDVGKVYAPENLPASMRVDGIGVEMVAESLMFDSHCGAQQVHIVSIERRSIK